MPTFVRPIKQFGFRTYTADFAAAPANPTPPPSNLYEIQTLEVDADLDGIVTTINALDDANIAPGANINGSKLLNTSVPIGKLVNTGFAKIAIAVGLIIDTAETDVAVLPSMTTTGVRVRLEGSPLSIALIQTGTGTLTFKWYEDGVAIPTSDVTLRVANPAGGTGTIIVPLPIPTFIREGATAAAHVYKLTAQTTDVKLQIVTNGSGGVGFLYATEIP